MAKDISEILKANRSKGTAKKSKVPVELADELHDEVYNAHVALTAAENNFRTVEKRLLDKTAELYEQGAKDGDFSKSMNLPGIETPGVQVSYKDQFSALDEDDEETVKELMGDDYSTYFEEKRTLKLLDSSNETFDLLIKKLGEKQFFELFEVKLQQVPKKDMDRRQFDLSAEVRVYLKQYKPSVKIAK